MIRLETPSVTDIPAHLMQDGDVGVITFAASYPDDVGKLVQRYNHNIGQPRIIILGESEESSFDESFLRPTNTSLRVRLVRSGEKLVVE